MANNKRHVEGIDEILMLSSIREKTPELPEREKPKESTKRKRATSLDYASAYLQNSALKPRNPVYIGRELFETISAIVRIIANREVTIGSYIDNIIMSHLETHKDDINELYKKERKDLIE